METTACPHCCTKSRIKPEWRGNRAKCKKCQASFTIPFDPAPPAPEPIEAVPQFREVRSVPVQGATIMPKQLIICPNMNCNFHGAALDRTSDAVASFAICTIALILFSLVPLLNLFVLVLWIITLVKLCSGGKVICPRCGVKIR